MEKEGTTLAAVKSVRKMTSREKKKKGVPYVCTTRAK
jgi:hypothetical protein